MNDTTTPQSGLSLLPDGIGAITAIHLVLMLLVAIAAIAIIVAGIRRKRSRVAAERQVAEHAEAAGIGTVAPGRPVPPEPPAPAPAPAPAPGAAPVEPPRDITPPARTEPPAPELIHDEPIHDEPIAAAAPQDQPVTLLKGLGPKVAARLAELGITRVGQIATLDDDAAAGLDARLGPFAGRLARDRWVEQARFLAAGDRAGFEAVFGRL